MKKKVKFTLSTLEDRIEFFRSVIRQTTESHGSPCMCSLCESLTFDYLAAEGKINLKTGMWKPK